MTPKKKVSIVVPFHWMENWQFFLNRCLNSIKNQTFTDYEIILMKVGSLPVTSNRVIEGAKGEIVKMLYMDDYFSHGNSLQEIIDNFKGGWLVTGCLHDDGNNIGNYHKPDFVGIPNLQNTIGSPSVLAFENKNHILFDENLSWLLDVDLYTKLYERYGEPTILDTPNVTIGLHKGQMTHILSNEQKQSEYDYLVKKKV